MFKKSVLKLCCGILCIGMLLTAGNIGVYASSDNVYAQSGLVAYDLFSYTKGTLLNILGVAGKGWAGSWQSTDIEAKAQNTDTSRLFYTDIGSMATSGAYAQFKQTVSRQFTPNLDAATNERWFSILAKADRSFTISFYDADAALLFSARQPSLGGAWEVGNGTFASSGKGATGVNLVVLRMSGTTVDLWANPVVADMISGTVPTADATFECASNLVMSKISLNGGGSTARADFLRIGCDVDSVLTDTAYGTNVPVFVTPVFSNAIVPDLTDITETGSVTATVGINYDETKPSRPVMFIVALYNADGSMADITIQPVADIKALAEPKMEQSIEVTDATQYIKAFVWDGIETVVPIDNTFKKIGV